MKKSEETLQLKRAITWQRLSFPLLLLKHAQDFYRMQIESQWSSENKSYTWYSIFTNRYVRYQREKDKSTSGSADRIWRGIP